MRNNYNVTFQECAIALCTTGNADKSASYLEIRIGDAAPGGSGEGHSGRGPWKTRVDHLDVTVILTNIVTI